MMWWWWAGCPKPPASVGPSESAPLAPERPAAREVVGPERVVQAQAPHLCVEVPAGWSGLTSPGTLFLSVSHPEGYRFSVSIVPDGAFPTERPGHHLLFEDAGTYRHVPLLPNAGTRAWAADDPMGSYLRAWTGTVRGVPVEVLLESPLGKITAGEEVFAPLLDRWCAPR
jgi:hypothetical protein